MVTLVATPSCAMEWVCLLHCKLINSRGYCHWHSNKWHTAGHRWWAHRVVVVARLNLTRQWLWQIRYFELSNHVPSNDLPKLTQPCHKLESITEIGWCIKRIIEDFTHRSSWQWSYQMPAYGLPRLEALHFLLHFLHQLLSSSIFKYDCLIGQRFREDRAIRPAKVAPGDLSPSAGQQTSRGGDLLSRPAAVSHLTRTG